MKFRHSCSVNLALAVALGVPSVPCRGGADPDSTSPTRNRESCITCHSDPDFLVTHPKLHEYYRDWESSIHAQEQVTCSDCHGGDPEASDAPQAHAGFGGESGSKDAVSFSKVHEVCGDCHDEIMESYRKSQHYAKLKESKGTRHGPTCVTCHSSMNTLTLDVTTVEAACARCHNQETQIDPKVPKQARAALNRFLSIDRFHRYIAARLDPAQAGRFFRQIDARVASLSVLWHTFDLERIEGETQAVLDVMRQKRDEIRAQRASNESSLP